MLRNNAFDLVDGKKKRILLRINGTQKKKERKKLDDQEKK